VGTELFYKFYHFHYPFYARVYTKAFLNKKKRKEKHLFFCCQYFFELRWDAAVQLFLNVPIQIGAVEIELMNIQAEIRS